MRYDILTLNPSPSLSQTRHTISAIDYADAVRQLRAHYRESGTRSALLVDVGGVYYWHQIGWGLETDRNTGNGFPAEQKFE